MIKKINFIKNTRSFLGFSANDKELTKKTVIYAPNGTGKTTLSRLMDQISKKEPLNNLISQEAANENEQDFEIVVDDESINKSNYLANNLNFLVFNTDYIDLVVRKDDFSKNDVSGEITIPIGEESNEIVSLKAKIIDYEQERDLKCKSLSESFEKLKEQKIQDKVYSKQDISIWEECKLDRLIQQTYIINIPTKLPDFDTCEKDFQDITGLTEESKINNPNIGKISFQLQEIEQIFQELATPKIFPEFDEATKASIQNITKDWINSHLLHKGVEKSLTDNECILCKRSLDEQSSQLFSSYAEYFKNEESSFKQKLENYQQTINDLKTAISRKNNNLQHSVSKVARTLGIAETWQEFGIEEVTQLLIIVEESIQQKISDCSLSLNPLEEAEENKGKILIEKLESLNEALEKNKVLIESINSKIDKTSNRKTELRKLIGQKLLYDLYIENKVTVDSVVELNKNISEAKSNLKNEESKLPKNSVVDNVVKLCNIFLHDYLYLKKYQLSHQKGVIQLSLEKTNISQNGQKISEGEKTMIALSYFLASSIKHLNSITSFDNGVFIIDDPVNSTGYSYFFGICNLIKHFHETIRKNVWNENTDDGKANIQKIILTHNSQFFNVMSRNIFKDKAEYFMLENDKLSTIGKNQLKSEFDNALINIKKAVTVDPNLSIGNDLRRFFETVRHFYGIRDFNALALKQIFPDFEEHKHAIFYTVINYYSHGNPEAHTDPLPTNFTQFKEDFVELISKSQFKDKWQVITI